MEIDERFFVAFGKEPDGPACAHENRLASGDSASDIWPCMGLRHPLAPDLFWKGPSWEEP